MIEKVNPSHPDKLADRIAGAIVDYAYQQQENPRIALEVLLGHGTCLIISETSVHIPDERIKEIVTRIDPEKVFEIHYKEVPQDPILSNNQAMRLRCGDNGIFKGVPLSNEETKLIGTAMEIYKDFPSDGKYILDGERLIICQSKAKKEDLMIHYPDAIINPLGFWTGGTEVDAGATNRKLGSDMGRGITGGGLHGKDLSKADVSVNIYAHLKAQRTGEVVELSCAIGDTQVGGVPYSEIVEIARDYIFNQVGGFEKFAEWGLLR